MDLAKSISDCKAKISIGKLPTIKGYEVELRLLFQNLLSNAFKYRKQGVTPDIRISSFKDNDHYIFSVNDNGIGIEEIDLENIFKIFNKIHRNDNFEGTGIGLAHCDKIVKLHDGKIWVDSQPGVGSTFHFKLKA
jgi:two-component system CheB/CheR fusion protein